MNKSSEDLHERLLGDDGYESSHIRDLARTRRQTSRQWLFKNALGLAILSLLIYIAALLTTRGSLACECAAEPSKHGVENHGHNHKHPTLPKLEYEERPEWTEMQHPWHGKPSDELDAAWDDLLYSLNWRVKKNELDYLNINSTNKVKVSTGDDEYVAVFGVYHHIHCLNNIRRLINWDYYGPKLSGPEYAEAFSVGHSNHCIDTMRQALMCHANTAVYTADWVHDKETHKLAVSKDVHSKQTTTCVKWNSLNDWARQRALVAGTYHYVPKDN